MNVNSNGHNALRELRRAIDAVQTNDQASISTDALSQYVNDLMAEVATARTHVEQQQEYLAARAKFENDMDVWKINAPLQTARDLEMFKSVIEAGGSALKAAMLVNGGAAIALLAFVGNAFAREASTEPGVDLAALNSAMLAFFCGTWLAAMAYGLRYISQYGYGASWKYCSVIAHIAAIIFGLASFCFFLWGGIIAQGGF